MDPTRFNFTQTPAQSLSSTTSSQAPQDELPRGLRIQASVPFTPSREGFPPAMPLQVPQQVSWVGRRALAEAPAPLVLSFGDKRFTVNPDCEQLNDIAALYAVLNLNDQQKLRFFLDAIPQAHLQASVVLESSETTLAMNYGQFLKFAITTCFGWEDFPVPAFDDQPIVEEYLQAPVIRLVHTSIKKLIGCYLRGANPPSQHHLRLVMRSLLERLKKVQNALDSSDPRPIEIGSINSEINTLLKVARHSYPGTPPADLLWLAQPSLRILIGAMKGHMPRLVIKQDNLLGPVIDLIDQSLNPIQTSHTTLKDITPFLLTGLVQPINHLEIQHIKVPDGYDPRNYVNLPLASHESQFYAWVVKQLGEFNGTGNIRLGTTRYSNESPSIRLLDYVLHDLKYPEGAEAIYNILRRGALPFLTPHIKLTAMLQTHQNYAHCTETLTMTCGTAIDIMMARFSRELLSQSNAFQNIITHTVTIMGSSFIPRGTWEIKRTALDLIRGQQHFYGVPDDSPEIDKLLHENMKATQEYLIGTRPIESLRQQWRNFQLLIPLFYPANRSANMKWMRSATAENFFYRLNSGEIPAGFKETTREFLDFLQAQRTPATTLPPVAPNVPVIHTLTSAQIAKGTKLYTKLAAAVERHWLKDKVACTALVNELADHGGKCEIRFENLSSEEKDAILLPIKKLLGEGNQSTWKVRLALLQDILEHFNITDRSKHRTAGIVSTSMSFEQALEQLLARKNGVSDHSGHADLTDDQLAQTSQTLLYLKIAELKTRSSQLALALHHEDDTVSYKPCMVCSQDEDAIRAEIYRAKVVGKRLEGLEKDFNAQLTRQALHSNAANIEIQREGDDLIARFEAADLPLLKRLSGSVLIAPRIQLTVQEQAEETVVQGESAVATRELESDGPGRLAGRKRASSDLPELPNAPHHKKRKTGLSEGSSSGRNTDYEVSGSYHPISGQPAEAMDIAEPATQQHKQHPNIPVQPTLSFGDTVVPNISWDNLHEALGIHTIANLERAVLREDGKIRLLKTAQPLNLPLAEAVANIEDISITPYNTLLKPYQKREVGTMLAFANHGLSNFLAAEMGLGKSYMIFEWLAQMVAKGREGVNLVLEPVSLIIQSMEELQKAWMESQRTAWLVRSRKGDDIDKDLVKTLSHAAEHNHPAVKLSVLAQTLVSVLPCLLNRKMAIGHEILPKYSEPLAKAVKEAAAYHIDQLSRVPAWKESLINEITAGSQPGLQIDIHGNIAVKPFEGNYWDCLERLNQMLSFHPGRTVTDYSHYDLQSARALTSVSAGSLHMAQNTSDLEACLRNKPTSGIIITSAEAIDPHNEKLLSDIHLSIVAMDEADRYHDPKNECHKMIKRVQAAQKGHKTHFQPFSGTPFQNSLAELWTLVKLPNGDELMPASEHAALTLTVNQAVGALCSDNPDINTQMEAVNRSFAYHAVLGETLRKVVRRVRKEDVKEDWNNRIPEARFHKIQGTISDQVKAVLGQIHANRRVDGHFTFWKAGQRTLLDPSLRNLQRNSPELNALIAKIKAAAPEEVAATVQFSPVLSALVEAEPVVRVMENNEKEIIFVDHIAEAYSLKAMLEQRYQANRPVITVYEGAVDQTERDQMIDEFRRSEGHPRVIIILKKTGRYGLNIPEPNTCIIASPSYNPSEDDQAWARCVRVNHVGIKNIYFLAFDTFLSHHVDVVRDEKKLWDRILLDDNITLEERYSLWLQLMNKMCTHAFLNNSEVGTLGAVHQKCERLQNDLNVIKERTTIEALQQKVDSVRPRPSKVVLPTPIDWSRQTAILAAILIDKQNDRTSFATLCDAIKNLDLATAIREHTLDIGDTTQIKIARILSQLEDGSNQAAEWENDYTIKVHDRDPSGAYVLVDTYNPGKPRTIELGRSMLDGRICYDILLPRRG
ncbi:MAG: DEAD/DEAH box helicase [Chlamydiales bacterium]|nr:DEAD/DEAH box helicase [Chlamydiales bacterium]